MARRTVVILLAVLTAALSVGCVTQGTHDLVLGERDDARASRDTLRVQLEEAQAANQGLRDELAATKVEAETQKGGYDDLIRELQGEVEAGQIQVQQLRDGVQLNVSDELLFPSGSARLNAAGKTLLEKVASQIDDKSLVTVEGHTDNIKISGALKNRYPTNWELAAARASSVVRLLADNGVDPARLRATSRGPYAPLESNDTPEGRAKNRRTEIYLRPMNP
ncbi:MAG: OmpA family protein [Myxococcota bacterium]